MYKRKKIAVIIPSYNEELLLPETLSSIPKFVDYIIVIDDASNDNTNTILRKNVKQNKKIIPIIHEVNQGLGQSLIDGYLKSLELPSVFATAVMAGDNQMDPNDLPSLLNKLINENYDYVKGNRLFHMDISSMPKYRLFGNSLLTLLTKFATGYYFSMDPQCGYTVIKNDALKKIPIKKMTKGYGYNADILCMLNIQGFEVADVEVRPVYGREKSKIKLWSYIPKTSYLLLSLFFRRLWQRYMVLDFHPLVLFYIFALLNIIFIIIPGLIRISYIYFYSNIFPSTTFMIVAFSFLVTSQMILFAIWMDMDYNKDRKNKKLH